MRQRLIVLGPQRRVHTVREAMETLGVSDGPVAVVSAGWQEREAEDAELGEHVDCEIVNLRLYQRALEVFGDDPELSDAYRQRQTELQLLQRYHRRRLEHALESAREMLREDGDSEIVKREQRSAIEAVKTLDKEHTENLRAVHREFRSRWSLGERPKLARHREQIAAELSRCGALLIAGGHVAILLNRIRLFDVERSFSQRPLVAWSAGAMVLANRIVLFHDKPPQGAGNPEVLEVGFGVAPGIVPLPHARRRLSLEDPVRVSLFARRFAPAICVPLDYGDRIDWGLDGWSQGSRGGRVLRTDGTIAEQVSA